MQRVASLEASKGELEGQLSGLAGLVAQLEARLREVTAQSQAASTAAELAAATAAQAQAAVGEQVAARLAAAGHNRSLWPPAARQEVAELEQQLEFMQVCCHISYLRGPSGSRNGEWECLVVSVCAWTGRIG